MRSRMRSIYALLSLFCIALTGCGSVGSVSNIQSGTDANESKVLDILAQYANSKLQAVQSGNLQQLLLVPEVENQRLRNHMTAYQDHRTQLADYGLSISLRKVEERAEGLDVVYTENVTLKEIVSGEEEYSYTENYHHALIRESKVISDEYIDISHKDFERLRALPYLKQMEVRPMLTSPFGISGGADQKMVPGRLAQPLSSSGVRDYAFRYCASPNPNFPYYGNLEIQGGDCTNFVSQCLEAGGLGFRDDPSHPHRRDWATFWWSNTSDRRDHSLTWSLVRSLKRHFEERFSPPVVHWVWEDAHIGDVVFMDFQADGAWDHACIVTTASRRADGTFALRVSCHSNSSCDEDFYLKAGRRGWWIQIVHMP